MNLSIRRMTLSLSLFVMLFVVLGGVYWFGASVTAPAASPALSLEAGQDPSGAAAGMSADAKTAAPLDARSATHSDARPLPEKVSLTEQERQQVLTEFFKAAEKDVQRLQAEISKAKADGLALADIAAMEEKLRKMQAVIQQVQVRNPGY